MYCHTYRILITTSSSMYACMHECINGRYFDDGRGVIQEVSVLSDDDAPGVVPQTPVGHLGKATLCGFHVELTHLHPT